MIIEIPTAKQVNVQYIKLFIPVRYEDEDMPYDFPLRNECVQHRARKSQQGRV